MTMPLDIPQLETERLILRAYDPARDFDRFAEFMTTEKSRFFLGPADRYGAWRLASAFVGHWVERGYGMWSIEEKATQDFCGMAGPWNPETWPEPELAWLLMADKEGRGIGTEAALCARDYLYKAMGWTTVTSSILPENEASIRLAKRLGATFEFAHDLADGAVLHFYRHPSPEAVQ